jgi:hypothetical protein
MTAPLATHHYQPGGVNAALDFLKRTRSELRSLRKARVWTDRMQVIDINGDIFEIRGIGYTDGDIVPLLRAVNAAFDHTRIQEPYTGEYKEFGTGRRHPWAEDRVM